MKPRQIFLAPDHDHHRCSSKAMATAEAVCERRGQRLTSMRRRVLAVLLGRHEPLGAYEIIEQLAPKDAMPVPKGARPARTSLRVAPITIYRALDFLRQNGLVHRIESRNAFVACVHNHAAADPVVFLICERCGAVGEASSTEVASTLKSAARAAGFTPKTPVLEITGVCTHCRDQ